MKNILIISNFIPPEHSATGRIAFSIAKELSKNNAVHLTCLSSNEEIPSCERLTVKKVLTRYGKYKKLVASALQKKGLGRLLSKIRYKIYYNYLQKKGAEDLKSHLEEFKKSTKKYVVENGIDTIITVSNPFETQEVGQYLKAQIKTLKWFPYLMDSNRHNLSYDFAVEKEREVLKDADKILIVPALTFDEDFCKDFEGKTEVVDLPIIPTETQVDAPQDVTTIKMIFAGMFYKEVRDPKPLLEFVSRLPKNYRLELYCGGYVAPINNYKEVLGERLSVNGFISPEELDKKMSDAHLVINIGNTVLNQVSSKAYDLIATGKPILNLYQNEKDISFGHLKKYPLCYHLDYQNINEKDVCEFVKWVEENANEKMEYLQATEKLKEKRLSSVADLILEIIK